VSPHARYDGFGDWYDEYTAPSAASSVDAITDLLGTADGVCIDLGCGTGLYFDVFRSTGRHPVGVDVSSDQLRLAVGRGPVAQADGAALPFRSSSVDTVAALWISTDVDDFASVASEAERCLTPGGTLLVYGVHPCFNGPLVEGRDDGSRIIHPGYRDGRWHTSSPWWGDGIRSKVGLRHVPLAELINAIAATGLRITRADEPRAEDVPFILALVARKA
jgi:SAM-dependent methyltransferase